MLPDSSHPDHTKLTGDSGFLKELLCQVLTSIGPAFIVVDGLDEIEEFGWRDLLSTMLDIKEKCVETKVLISSREVRGITLALEGHADPIRVDKNNLQDIQLFVRSESRSLLLQLERCGASNEALLAIRTSLESIAEKSDGMTASLGNCSLLLATLVADFSRFRRYVPLRQACFVCCKGL